MLEIVLFIAIIYLIIKNTLVRPKDFPPGPTVYPFLGNFFNVDLTAPNSDMHRLHKDYNDVGLIFPFYKAIVLKDPDLLNEMFNNEALTGRPDVIFNRDRFNGKNLGLMFTDARLWKLNKRFILHHFHNTGMGTKRQEAIVLDEVQEMLTDIDSYGSKPFKIESLFYHANINITWAIFGGDRFSHSDPKLNILGDALKAVTHQFNIVGGILMHVPILRKIFPTLSGYTKFMYYSDLINGFCKEVVENHVKTRIPHNPRDLIDAYLDEMEIKKAPADAFNLEQLIAICSDSLVGGSDTGSGTLSFAILFLIFNPEKQEKMAEEVHRVVGTDRLPSVEDRAKLTYCRAVFNETLRLRPPAPVILAHRAMADTKIGKYNVPKDTYILPHIEATFWDNNNYEDARSFKPERFIDKDGNLYNTDSVIAFAKGKRVCPGEGQARLSNVLILASLIQRYQFTFPKDDPLPPDDGPRDFLLSCPYYRVIATKRVHS